MHKALKFNCGKFIDENENLDLLISQIWNFQYNLWKDWAIAECNGRTNPPKFVIKLGFPNWQDNSCPCLFLSAGIFILPQVAFPNSKILECEKSLSNAKLKLQKAAA